MAFELRDGTPTEAVRLALARCASPMRIERDRGRVRIVIEADAAARDARWWARCGLEPHPVEPWPAADASGPFGAIAAAGRWWCLGRAPLAAGCHLPAAVLLLMPVDAGEVARALATALRPFPLWPRRVSSPRPLARACARVLSATDAVVRASAVALASGASPFEARELFDRGARAVRPRPIRLRVDVAREWRGLDDPSGGVWRTLGDLEAWWAAP